MNVNESILNNCIDQAVCVDINRQFNLVIGECT